ncbi:MAG: hypothetical protein K2V38_26230 [Gemmataceae bacterium]|nr:hypothetical protein [Gemmataceae bacterium]
MNFHHRLAVLAAAVACAAVLGCGGKPTGDLSGSVTYKGKSVVSGTVTVYDSENKAYQGGIDQGKYTVKNIPEGSVQIIVLSPDPNTSEGSREEKGRKGREARPNEEPQGPKISGWFPIPRKYGETSSSPLKTTIKAGANPYDLELKD